MPTILLYDTPHPNADLGLVRNIILPLLFKLMRWCGFQLTEYLKFEAESIKFSQLN